VQSIKDYQMFCNNISSPKNKQLLCSFSSVRLLELYMLIRSFIVILSLKMWCCMRG